MGEEKIKVEIKNKLKEMFKDFVKKSLEETIFDEYFKIAEEYVNNKPYNLENNLTMIGFAVEINRLCSKIQDDKLRIELEEKTQMIWDKWYNKVQNTINGFNIDKEKKVKN
jgi:putative uncharacterized protein FNV2263